MRGLLPEVVWTRNQQNQYGREKDPELTGSIQ
jgi:hypothetical protein